MKGVSNLEEEDAYYDYEDWQSYSGGWGLESTSSGKDAKVMVQATSKFKEGESKDKAEGREEQELTQIMRKIICTKSITSED